MKLSKKQLARIGYAVAAAIAAFLTAMGFSSCGITRASISKPQQGTTTTVTITTNNPMTTTVNPITSAEVTTNKK